MRKKQAVTASTRLTPSERARLQAMADIERTTVSAIIHRLVMPGVDECLRKELAAAGK